MQATIFNDSGALGCFLTNKNDTLDATISFQGNSYFVPAWSVSVLPDCKTEVFNTAKVLSILCFINQSIIPIIFTITLPFALFVQVTTQTTKMVKRTSIIEEEPLDLNWLWKPEDLKDAMMAKSSIVKSGLSEQIMVSGDASDYLWYMTR